MALRFLRVGSFLAETELTRLQCSLPLNIMIQMALTGVALTGRTAFLVFQAMIVRKNCFVIVGWVVTRQFYDGPDHSLLRAFAAINIGSYQHTVFVVGYAFACLQ